MVVTNFDGTLEVGVAFQLILRNLPVRRGIVVSVNPTTKEPHVWYENKSVKRERGDSHIFIGIFEGFSNEDIPKLTITHVPCRFDSWLSRVPAQVRIACGSIRARPGPKVGVPSASNIIHPDFVKSPGCSPPRSLSPSEDVKSNVKKNRIPPMISQLAQVRVALNMMDNKLDLILQKFEKLEKE